LYATSFASPGHSCLRPVTLFIRSVFFFSAPATTALYTLSLHDALPIWRLCDGLGVGGSPGRAGRAAGAEAIRSFSGALGVAQLVDRKSTRLNSSHVATSYAVFCLKKKIDHSLLHPSRRRSCHRPDRLHA